MVADSNSLSGPSAKVTVSELTKGVASSVGESVVLAPITAHHHIAYAWHTILCARHRVY